MFLKLSTFPPRVCWRGVGGRGGGATGLLNKRGGKRLLLLLPKHTDNYTLTMCPICSLIAYSYPLSAYFLFPVSHIMPFMVLSWARPVGLAVSG